LTLLAITVLIFGRARIGSNALAIAAFGAAKTVNRIVDTCHCNAAATSARGVTLVLGRVLGVRAVRNVALAVVALGRARATCTQSLALFISASLGIPVTLAGFASQTALEFVNCTLRVGRASVGQLAHMTGLLQGLDHG
jgi:hypothetical protein